MKFNFRDDQPHICIASYVSVLSIDSYSKWHSTYSFQVITKCVNHQLVGLFCPGTEEVTLSENLAG